MIPIPTIGYARVDSDYVIARRDNAGHATEWALVQIIAGKAHAIAPIHSIAAGRQIIDHFTEVIENLWEQVDGG